MSSRQKDLQQALKRAVSAYKAGRLAESERLCKGIVAAQSGAIEVHHLLAIVQAAQGKLDAALTSCEQVLARRPDDAEALQNRGKVLSKLGRHDEALSSYDGALSVRPTSDETLYLRGMTLKALGRPEEALASYNRVLKLRPEWVEVRNSHGNLLTELHRYDEALASYDQALAERPGDAEILYNRGNVLGRLKRFDDALASYDQALAARPDWVSALNHRATVLTELKRFDEALASYDRALAIRPDDASTLYNRGHTLRELDRLDEALASYEQVLQVDPNHADAMSGIANCVIGLCLLNKWDQLAGQLAVHVSGKKSLITPFVFLRYSDDPGLHLQCARNYVQHLVPSPPTPLWNGEAWRHHRIRVAYISADYQRHATSNLMAELFERHDRSRFEVTAVSYGPDDGSAMRERLVAAFDRFLDVRGSGDREIAHRLRDLEIDIAVDLKGHTRDARTKILAHRPAPIQASYLGYPGTMGAEFIDYAIADPVVAPFEHQPYYSERIVHLPDCYQVNDSTRIVSEESPTRAEVGLPEQGFVFCCFNQTSKISPHVFTAWMRILHRVDDSVLWLFLDHEGAAANLRDNAARQGVDPSRIVFARGLPLDQHLARQRLADLFLDTLPYNAHTTASDALRVGLPVLTCQGEAFAGRVAASLLRATGLPELITTSLDDYEALAAKLASEPELLSRIRRKLTTNLPKAPLFDTDLFRRNIEAAYTEMWKIWQRGERPRGFAVTSPTESQPPRRSRRQRATLRARQP